MLPSTLNFETNICLISAVVNGANSSLPPCLYDTHREVIKVVSLAHLWSSQKVQILQGTT